MCMGAPVEPMASQMMTRNARNASTLAYISRSASETTREARPAIKRPMRVCGHLSQCLCEEIVHSAACELCDVCNAASAWIYFYVHVAVF